MSAKDTNPNRRADLTRKAILRAAIREFSAHGLAGARTDAIAESAKVNKALLYYYFKSKSGLYAAAIEEVFDRGGGAHHGGPGPRRSAGERLLRTALSHFDRILTQHDFQSLMQQEMVRMRRGESEAMPCWWRTSSNPCSRKLQQAVRDGIATGELCRMDWLQVIYSALGANVLLFSQRAHDAFDAPVRSYGSGRDRVPAQSRGGIPGQCTVCRPAHGARLAKRVLAEMPMPKGQPASRWRKFV